MNKKGDLDTGIYILFAVVLGALVLASLSGTTGAIFQSVGSGLTGFSGLVVTNFNVILLVAITILAFIGVRLVGE